MISLRFLSKILKVQQPSFRDCPLEFFFFDIRSFSITRSICNKYQRVMPILSFKLRPQTVILLQVPFRMHAPSPLSKSELKKLILIIQESKSSLRPQIKDKYKIFRRGISPLKYFPSPNAIKSEQGGDRACAGPWMIK